MRPTLLELKPDPGFTRIVLVQPGKTGTEDVSTHNAACTTDHRHTLIQRPLFSDYHHHLQMIDKIE